MSRSLAFTLIELLVVIAIIAVMIAWLLPALKSAREQARLVACLSNSKQLSSAIAVYANDHEGFFPVPPLGQYFTTNNLDSARTWMHAFIGGNDIGGWPVVHLVPAEVRPLADYVYPYSHVWRCPSDDGPTPWTYGRPEWDQGCTSYRYNADPQYGRRGLYDYRTDEVNWPSLTIVIGDKQWTCIGPNLPSNDHFFFQNDPRAWWHPEGFRRRKAATSFADSHSEYIPVQIMVWNTHTYRRDPQ